jgi:uncharacterized membrane protein YvbJ
MYCSSCGEEIADNSEYCSSCGHEIGTAANGDTEDGVDYDIAMSVEDAISRRSGVRWVVDIIALVVSVGFWGGFLAVEFLIHHSNLKKGETKPWEDGDDKEFWIM